MASDVSFPILAGITPPPPPPPPTPHHHYTRLNRKRGAMEPSMKQILDTLNARFDEFDRHVDDRDRAFADRTGSVDSRFSTQATGIEQRLARIEAHLPDPAAPSVEQRLADFEASHADATPTTPRASPSSRPAAPPSSRTSAPHNWPCSRSRPSSRSGFPAWRASLTTSRRMSRN